MATCRCKARALCRFPTFENTGLRFALMADSGLGFRVQGQRGGSSTESAVPAPSRERKEDMQAQGDLGLTPFAKKRFFICRKRFSRPHAAPTALKTRHDCTYLNTTTQAAAYNLPGLAREGKTHTQSRSESKRSQ